MGNEQEKLDQLISTLSQKKERLQVYYDRLTKSGTQGNHIDFLGIAVIKRSCVLIDGFITLLSANNFIAAAHLVRLHLDNYLRLYALWMVPDALDFSKRVLAGERIDQMKDRKGNSLKDWYLLEAVENDYPWMRKVYEESSGFVHLSGKHIHHATVFDYENERITLVSDTNAKVKIESKIEGTDCMNAITTCVCFLLYIMCNSKERDLNDPSVFTVPRVPSATTFDPVKHFKFLHEDRTYDATVEHFVEDEHHKYRVVIRDWTMVIAPAALKTTVGQPIWVQCVASKDTIWTHQLIQKTGEALSAAGLVIE